MQYKIPRIPTFEGLEGIDSRIQEIQVKMASELSWLEYSFGMCNMVVRDEDEKKIPVCHIDNTSDPLDMRPWLDDAHDSYSFWDLIDPGEIEYSGNLSVRRYPALIYTVACIVVVNLDQINTDRKVAKSITKQRLYKFFHQSLRFTGTYQMDGIFDKDIEQIFEGYDIEDPLLFLRDQFAAFRVEGTITFKQDCSDTPVLQSAEVGNVANNIIVATYDKALDTASVPASGDYSLSGTSTGISSVAIDGLTVRLTLDDNIIWDETIYLDYTKGTNPIRDLLGGDADNFTLKSVTNNSTAPRLGLWNQPSWDELDEIYTELFLEGVGGLSNTTYWASSEHSATFAKQIRFVSGIKDDDFKSTGHAVRASRSFTAPAGSYSLRDVGPGSGLVYIVNSTTYYESYPTDQGNSQAWSNITTLIGTTGTAIGDGAQNTLDIIGQAGHTTSAAKLCNDLN